MSCILSNLARNPERRAQILADPALWPSAIEELMRFESPVTQGFRHVVEDVELPSGTMTAGTNAILWWAAANVDPEAFDEPMTVRLDRSPNAHICFASGWHRCLGSHLARLTLNAIFPKILQRMADLEPTAPAKYWPADANSAPNVVGPKTMPVKFTPGPKVGQ